MNKSPVPKIIPIIAISLVLFGFGMHFWHADQREKAIYYCAEYLETAGARLAAKGYFDFQLKFSDAGRKLTISYEGQWSKKGIMVHEAQLDWATVSPKYDRTYYLSATGAVLFKDKEVWKEVDSTQYAEARSVFNFLAIDQLNSPQAVSH